MSGGFDQRDVFDVDVFAKVNVVEFLEWVLGFPPFVEFYDEFLPFSARVWGIIEAVISRS